jgi:hypothetical protein
LGGLLFKLLDFSGVVLDNIFSQDELKTKFFNDSITPKNSLDPSTPKEKIQTMISTEAKRTQLLNVDNFQGISSFKTKIIVPRFL